MLVGCLGGALAVLAVGVALLHFQVRTLRADLRAIDRETAAGFGRVARSLRILGGAVDQANDAAQRGRRRAPQNGKGWAER